MSVETPLSPEKLVDLSDLLAMPAPLMSLIKRPLESFLGLTHVNRYYASIQHHSWAERVDRFFELGVEGLDLCYELEPGELARIPREGPVVVVANHPHGMADGIILGDVLRQVRSDIKLMANEQLSLCPELVPWLIQVNPFDTAEARKTNLKGIREALAHLREGGLLAVFPAGSASSLSLRDRRVVDDAWNPNIANIIRRTGASVVPMHLSGRNSSLFQMVSLIRKPWRVAMLPRELRRNAGRLQRIRIGQPVQASLLKGFDRDKDLIANLRLRTYLLPRNRGQAEGERTACSEDAGLPAIIGPEPVELLRAEVAQLPRSQRLVESGAFEVYHATADQIPLLMQEIGRLREITFRAVGEGSGSSCDLDSFDDHYQHLFLWDRVKGCLCGAYRMGQTDQILDRLGVEGLYNSSFFKFDPRVIEGISPGIEMGRSFVVKEYQGRPLSLGLLWQGIGQFIARNPHYRYLFGVVSTSNTYSGVSRGLIVNYLKHKAMNAELARFVKANNPPSHGGLSRSERLSVGNACRDASDLSSLVSAVEADGKGIPVLLKHYLKLNGRILSFNIDKNFGNVLDCLILVDLYKSPERSLKRYLGKELVGSLKSQGLLEASVRE